MSHGGSSAGVSYRQERLYERKGGLREAHERGVLQTEVHSRERFDQNVATSAINSILSCGNVVYELGRPNGLCWMRSIVRYQPSRKQFMSFMWEKYVQGCGDESHIPLSSFTVCVVLLRTERMKHEPKCADCC